MLRKLTLAILIFIMIAGLASGKTHIRGFILDEESGEPLPVANVIVKGTNRGGATNLDGFFTIPNMDPGKYTLHVSYLGYNSREVEIELKEGSIETFRIEISPQSMRLEEVVYTEDQLDEDEIRQSARVSTIPVDGNTIRKLPALGGEVDVLRALQAVPGVKASSDISSNLYVRGGSADMTLIQMDQSTIYNPAHLFGIFSTFNSDAVKHLELMKGAFPAEYGGRAGSVLNVVSNEGNRRKAEGLASVGIISARGALEGPLPNKRGSYALSGRRTYFEPVLEMLRNSSESMSDLPDYFFYDTNGKINLDLSDRTTFTFGGYVGQDELTAEFGPDDSRMNIGTEWGNQTVHARVRHVLPVSSFITFGATFSRYHSDFYFENEGIIFQDFQNTFQDAAFRTDYEYYGLDNHKIKTGIDFHIYDVNTTQDVEDTRVMTIDTTNTNLSHYIQDEWKIGSQFEIMPGIRWTWHEDGNLFRVDPRLAFLYHYDTKTRLKLAGGRYHQWIELVAFGEGFSFTDMWIPFDGTLDPTYSDQVVIGIEHDPTDDTEITFETYYNDFNDLHMMDQSVDRGKSMEDVFYTGEGYAYGFEWMLRKKSGRLNGWIGYSLAWSKRKFPDPSASGRIYNEGDWFYPKWDRRHDFIIVGNYKLSNRWDVSTQWRYNTGQGYTRALGIYTTQPYNVGTEYSPNEFRTAHYGEQNNYRLPADHRLDLTFTYNHKFFGQDAKLNLSVYNVYNRRSIWFRDYDTDENPVEASDVKLLPILPLVSYEVRF